MKLHVLQNVDFEGPAAIADWAQDRGFGLDCTRMHRGEQPPHPHEFDWLVVMGGPMNVHQHRTYPWLATEKAYVRRCMDQRKLILGICLGAQILADVLGGDVVRNPHVEIGWHPVSLTSEAEHSRIFRELPHRFVPFHWHGDTFATPPGCLRTAQSEACANQAFQWGDRIVGLQFHLDYTAESVRMMLEHCRDELVEAPYVQSPEEMAADPERLDATRDLLYTFMDRMAEANS